MLAVPAARPLAVVIPEPVDLLLVLAVDTSSSIDRDVARLQREGHCAALCDPSVIALVRSGPCGAIGLTYVEWSGVAHQRLVLPWTRIASLPDATAWSEALARKPLLSLGGTSIAGGIDFARRVLSDAPWPAERRVIDVSGDGLNNGSLPVEAARDRAVAENITINGIAVGDGATDIGSVSPPGELEDHYRNAVVGGPGAFVVTAEDFGGFGAALRRKLRREIAEVSPLCVGRSS
ncbi:DUF1194 domain-containing protein [Dankookia rubra]|uniref:DUF1194 domain-containing protein n=2 Tax=Dankookia rubra TaxID=1442381 RepID=A0A4R5Q7H2_9PROT|nr:DUF1194 domain-containing protein [Dankookia rubra]